MFLLNVLFLTLISALHRKTFFLLVYNCFTMFCWFLLYNDMNQLLFLLFSCLVVSNSLQPHELQLASLPCCSLSPRVCSNSCSLSRWCHPTISSSVTPFSCSQSFPAWVSFPMSWVFTSSGQSIGASASAQTLAMNILGWFPLGLTGLISFLSKGLSRVFSSTTIWKYQFFGAQLSLWSKSHIRILLQEKP